MREVKVMCVRDSGVYYIDSQGILNFIGDKGFNNFTTKYHIMQSGNNNYTEFDKIPNCKEITCILGNILLLLMDGSIVYNCLTESYRKIPEDVIPLLVNIERIACYSYTYFLIDYLGDLHCINTFDDIYYKKYSNVKDFGGNYSAVVILDNEGRCYVDDVNAYIPLPGVYQSIECSMDLLGCLSNEAVLSVYMFANKYACPVFTLNDIQAFDFADHDEIRIYTLTNSNQLTIYRTDVDDEDAEELIEPSILASVSIGSYLDMGSYIFSLDDSIISISNSISNNSKIYIEQFDNYELHDSKMKLTDIDINSIKRLMICNSSLIVESCLGTYMVFHNLNNKFHPKKQSLYGITLLDHSTGSYI